MESYARRRGPLNVHRAPTTRLFPNAALATLLVGSISIMGCAGSANWPFANNTSPSVSAPEHGLTKYEESARPTRSYVEERARESHMPRHHVSEARIGLAEIEKALAEARAMEAEQKALLEDGLARVEAHRRHAQAVEQGQLAEAEKIQEQYAAKQNELWVAIAANERGLESERNKNAALIASLRKEREQAYQELKSRAWKDFENAQAQIDKLNAIRNATAREGEAALESLHESAKATTNRSAATVAKLRREATSVRDQTDARAEELVVRINTVREQTQSKSKQLATKANSVAEDAIAQYEEMTARADALTEQASEERYDLRVDAARTEYRQAQSEYERMTSQAESRLERAQADIDRLQGEAEEIAFIGESNFTHGKQELDAWLDNEQAEIDKLMARAQRMEEEARAEFVKAEAEARAKAAHETATHLSELAEATQNAIIAEAEAEAVRVRAEILEELARRQKEGSVEFAGKTDGDQQLPEDLHAVPLIPQVESVVPQVEPEHIAGFRSNLARVMRLRANANAQQLAMEATFEESSDQLQAVRAQYLALSAEKLALAEAKSTQAMAQYNDMTAKANAYLAVAEAKYDRTLVDAEAFRKEKIAEAAELRAEAKATRELAKAHADLLRVESKVVKNNGESEVRALEAALNAIRKRGTAEHRRLVAEANSIEESKRALSEQINAQIAAAERVLEAELAKQDRSIDSAIAVAEANYDEAMVNAEVFSRKSEVEIDRLAAQQAHRHALVSTEIDHMRNLSYSTELLADAEVTRMIANAQAQREQSEALADVGSASLHAQHDMFRADAIARSRSAEAREDAVKATFDARLVQVESERIRDLADQYRDEFFQKTNLETALAEAEAIRSQLNDRFEALKVEQQHMHRTAQRNWDSRLAAMQQRPDVDPENPDLNLPEDLRNIQITNVPITRD